MNKYTRTRLKIILGDIEAHFSEVIDFIIHYDSISEDNKAWDLIYKVEDLGHQRVIELLLSDFESRDLSKVPTLLYNAFLYGLVNDEDTKSALVSALQTGDHERFKNHLYTLDEKHGRTGDLNIADVRMKLQNQTNHSIGEVI